MKTLFLKNSISIAIVAFGISGAFLTTSIQGFSQNNAAPKIGYLQNSGSVTCSEIQVICSINPSPFLCRLGGISGPIAYDRDLPANNCIQPLYRP